MANEFIARKGIIVLSNGAKITGSTLISGNVTASGDIKATNFHGSGQYLTDIAADSVQWNNVLNKPSGLVSSSTQVEYTQLQNIPNGIVSSSTQFTSLTAPFTGSFTGSFNGTITGAASTSSYVEYSNVANKPTLVSASSQIDHDQTTNFVANEHVDHSTVNISAGNGLTGGGDITTTRTLTLDTASVHFTSGVKTKLNTDGVFSSSAQVTYNQISSIPAGIVSSSSQIDVRNTTGIATIATTGSNTFTGVQTISNTTNSTDFTNGALIVQGGVGITKDVNISGSLTITGLLTATSMSTQYVTSSQYTIGTSRVIVNDDDTVRFAGLSVIDSGSTYGTGSLLWDSLNNHWIYEADDQNYNSAVIIAGPKHSGSLGDEPLLVSGRVPVASGGDHIDNRVESSSIRVDFPSRLTHIEAGLQVTGSISSSVGFSGNGSGLTNVVASSVDFTNITNKPTLVSASSQIDHDATTNFVANEHIDHSTVSITAGAGLNGGGNITATRTLSVDSGSMLPYYSSSIFSTISGDITITAGGVASIAANSVALGTDTTGNYASAVTAGSGIIVDGTAGEGTSFSISVDTGSVHFLDGVKKQLNTEGVLSSSAQVVNALPVGTVSSSLQFNSLSSPFTGSFTGSFAGDGSNLTGIATVLAVSASDGTTSTGTVNLKTQALSFSAGEGIDLSMSDQTLTVAGEDATTTNKGIASFNTTNFDVVSGAVSSKNITINGTGVTLGGTRNITLSEITTAGATTPTQVTLGGGAVIHGVLFTSSSATSIAGPVSNQIVASIATGSYDAAHFDYILKDGTNYRTGTVMAVWNGTNSVEFTDTSTNDIGNTLDEIFTVDANAGNIRLKLTTDTGTWSVKTAIRVI